MSLEQGPLVGEPIALRKFYIVPTVFDPTTFVTEVGDRIHARSTDPGERRPFKFVDTIRAMNVKFGTKTYTYFDRGNVLSSDARIGRDGHYGTVARRGGPYTYTSKNPPRPKGIPL